MNGDAIQKIRFENGLFVSTEFQKKCDFLYKNSSFIFDNEDKFRTGKIILKDNVFVFKGRRKRKSRKPQKKALETLEKTESNFGPVSTTYTQPEESLFASKLKKNFPKDQNRKVLTIPSITNKREKTSKSKMNSTQKVTLSNSSRISVPSYLNTILKKNESYKGKSKLTLDRIITEVQSEQVKRILRHKKILELGKQKKFNNFEFVVANYFEGNQHPDYLSIDPTDPENKFVNEIKKYEETKKRLPSFSKTIEDVEKTVCSVEKGKIHVSNDVRIINKIYNKMKLREKECKSEQNKPKHLSKIKLYKSIFDLKNKKPAYQKRPTLSSSNQNQSSSFSIPRTEKSSPFSTLVNQITRSNKLVLKRLTRIKLS